MSTRAGRLGPARRRWGRQRVLLVVPWAVLEVVARTAREHVVDARAAPKPVLAHAAFGVAARLTDGAEHGVALDGLPKVLSAHCTRLASHRACSVGIEPVGAGIARGGTRVAGGSSGAARNARRSVRCARDRVGLAGLARDARTAVGSARVWIVGAGCQHRSFKRVGSACVCDVLACGWAVQVLAPGHS